MAVRLDILPVGMDQSRLIVVMAEPQNVTTADELRFTSGKDISPRLGFRAEIVSAIVKNYDQFASTAPARQASAEVTLQTEMEMEFISTSSRQANRDAIQEIQAELNQKKTPAVRLVSKSFTRRWTSRPATSTLNPKPRQPLCGSAWTEFCANWKAFLEHSELAGVPHQDFVRHGYWRAPRPAGRRFMVAVGQRRVDMRVSTLPTQYGEKVVIRLLEASAPILSFVDLGFPPDVANHLMQLIALPQGMLLVTGPTGSGKSTTLYSALNLLRKPAVNIVTVEDPVEYALPGVNQVHVNTRAGLTLQLACARSCGRTPTSS